MVLSPPRLRTGAQENRQPRKRRQQVIRALEAHARKKNEHRAEPDQTESQRKVAAQLRLAKHVNHGNGYDKGPWQQIERRMREKEPPRMRLEDFRAQAAFDIVKPEKRFEELVVGANIGPDEPRRREQHHQWNTPPQGRSP